MCSVSDIDSLVVRGHAARLIVAEQPVMLTLAVKASVSSKSLAYKALTDNNLGQQNEF